MRKYMILTAVISLVLFSADLAHPTNNLFVNNTLAASDRPANDDAVPNVTYVPLRAIVEDLGGTIGWDEQSHPSVVIEERSYQKDAFNLVYPYFLGINNKAAQSKMNKEIETMIQEFIAANTNNETKEAIVKYNVHSLSQDMISFTLTKYTYTGGAHGASFREGYTYDLATGTRCEFSDLFEFDNAGRSSINAQITAQIKERTIPTFGPFQGVSDRPYFYIADNDQPIVFFQQYDIGPYSVGILEFPVVAKKVR